MNKILIIIFALVGSFSLVPFDKSGASYTGGIDTVKHILPENKYVKETKLVYQMLERYHYRHQLLNDSLSSVIFDNYLSSLDYNKSFFLDEDIQSFEPYRYKLDDAIKAGDLETAFDIYNVYQDRLFERMDWVDSLLKKKFDFEKDETYQADRENEDWARDVNELNEIWRKSIKNQVLNLKISGKELDESYKLLQDRYERYKALRKQYNASDVYQTFMNAYTTSYDPHTNYFNPATADNFDIEMSRSLEGIGARLSKDGDYTIVVDIIAGGPAYRGNELHKDDRITGVGQGEEGEIVDVVGWRNDDVVKLIRGKKGTVVRLQVLKAIDGPAATNVIVRIERDKVNIEEQRAVSEIISLKKDGKFYEMGVITIPDFYKDFSEARKGNDDFNSTTRDVKKLIEDLNADGIDGLLIDLRRNGGGALDEAIELTGLFIKEGPVVQVRDGQNKIDVGKDEDSGLYYDGPLTVLISRSSASASEIFSGAIQDYKRGLIVGNQSFGKGTVQNLIDLNRVTRASSTEYGNLKITLAKYYRITGSSTQNTGVTPDVALPSSIDSDIFGESSYPASLPWDEIGPAEFESTNKISEELIDMLNREYLIDLNSDPQLRELVEDIQKSRERRNQTSVSLNEVQRLSERDLNTNPESSSVVGGESTVSTETGTVEDPAKIDDVYLKEGLRLLATIVDRSIG